MLGWGDRSKALPRTQHSVRLAATMMSQPYGNTRIQSLILRIQPIVALITVPALFVPELALEKLSWLGGFGQPPMLPLSLYLLAGGCAVFLALAGLQWIIATDVVRYRPLVLFAAWGYLVCGPLFLWIDSHVGLPHWWTALDSVSCLLSGLVLLWACRPR